MKNEQLYHKTVDILVAAYFNNTLKHSDCAACAVGNIVASNGVPRLSPHNVEELNNSRWGYVFSTNLGGTQRVTEENYKNEAKICIDATGYSWQELAKIEYAFETAPHSYSQDEFMFNGLMAVINVLDEIHENKDIATNINTKKKFKKETNGTI